MLSHGQEISKFLSLRVMIFFFTYNTMSLLEKLFTKTMLIYEDEIENELHSTIRTLVQEKIYYGLLFPRVKQFTTN